MVIAKKVKKLICNKRGYTIPTALAFMLLLLALAGSILLVASYRYQNVYIRKQQEQLYIYARSLVEQHTESIEDGRFNATLAGALAAAKPQDPALSKYAKSYGFVMKMDSGAFLVNDLMSQDIDFQMFITYEPQEANVNIPSNAEDVVKIGDYMKVEYRITEKNMEYRIVANYYCSKDMSVDSGGVIVPAYYPKRPEYMKWTVNQYMGNFYNLRNGI